MEDRFLTVEDVCKILRVKRGAVYQLKCARLLPFYKIGRRLLFTKKDVNEYLNSRYTRAIDTPA